MAAHDPWCTPCEAPSEAGLPALGLSVTDRNPARRMYDDVGFRPVTRMLAVLLPGFDG